MRAKLSSYAESEITSLVPQAPSSLPSFAVRSASDGKLGGSLLTRLLMALLNVNQNLLASIYIYILAECVALWGEPEQAVAGVSNRWTGIWVIVHI